MEVETEEDMRKATMIVSCALSHHDDKVETDCPVASAFGLAVVREDRIHCCRSSPSVSSPFRPSVLKLTRSHYSIYQPSRQTIEEARSYSEWAFDPKAVQSKKDANTPSGQLHDFLEETKKKDPENKWD